MNSDTQLAHSSHNLPVNTKDGGIVEFTIFEEESNYVGVCITFDIVVEGSHYEEVRHELMEAARLHIETVRKHDLPASLLNRRAPQEYWDKRNSPLRVDGHEQRTFESLLPSPYTEPHKAIS